MGRVTLRPARPGDSAFAYAARKAALGPYLEQTDGWHEATQRQLHERRFAMQDFRIVSRDGADVGIVAVALAADGLKVNQLMLLPEHQGQGIGRDCMALLAAEAERRGVPIRLRVMKVNPRARAFYERLGFVHAGETDTHHLMERAPAARGPVGP